MINDKYLKEQHKIDDIPQHKFLTTTSIVKMDINQIISYVELFYCDYQENLYKNRNTPPNIVAMYLAEILGQYTLSHISRHFNITISGVSKACKRLRQAMLDNYNFKKEIENVRQFVIDKSNFKT